MLIFSLSVPKHVSPDIARSGVLAGVALHFVNVGDGDNFCRSLSSSEVRILHMCTFYLFTKYVSTAKTHFHFYLQSKFTTVY